MWALARRMSRKEESNSAQKQPKKDRHVEGPLPNHTSDSAETLTHVHTLCFDERLALLASVDIVALGKPLPLPIPSWWVAIDTLWNSY